MFAAALVDFFAQATCSEKSLLLGIEEEPVHFSLMSRPTQKDAIAQKKSPKDRKKDPALVRVNEEKNLINSLELAVPRALQAEAAQKHSPDHDKEALKQKNALRAFTTVSTAHAGRAAGAAPVAYPRGHPMRRNVIEAEYAELSNRRIKMLLEDQGWDFVPHASKKDEEEALQSSKKDEEEAHASKKDKDSGDAGEKAR